MMILHAATNSMQVSIPEIATRSLDQFRAWVYSDAFPNEGKFTYFQTQVLMDMAAERANAHAEVKQEIAAVLKNLVRQKDLGKLYGDGMWFTSAEADLSNEPDASFVSWESLQSGRVRLVSSLPEEDGIEYQGGPDWTLEVVSNSSVVKDTQWLPEAYHLAGVREYWLVDARGTDLQFTTWLWRPEGFVTAPLIDQSQWPRSEVFDCDVCLERTRDRIGGWDYQLLTRASKPRP